MSTNGARIVHRSPGRLRVRVDRARHDVDLIHRIVERLSRVPGVKQIETAPETGSILVLFEPSRFDEERLASEARDGELFYLQRLPAESKEARSEGGLARSLWQRTNMAVNQKSRGPIDLRTLVPLALVGWAIKQIVTERPIPRTPWYTLLWYAWGIFTRFNPPNEVKSTDETAV
jgi:hypothetical protein